MVRRFTYTLGILMVLVMVAQAQPAPPQGNDIAYGIHTDVEQMPYFAGCEDLSDAKGKRACSNENVVRFLAENIQYPEEARQQRMEGTVLVSFVIDEKGVLGQARVLRDVGGGCGEEALRVLAAMPDWEPANKDGKPVKVDMKLPVRFYLSTGVASNYRIYWGNLRGERAKPSQVGTAAKGQLMVRNEYGNEMSISSLSLLYGKGDRLKEEKSSGVITPEMDKLIRRVKPGNQLTIVATVQRDGEPLEVARTFDIVEE